MPPTPQSELVTSDRPTHPEFRTVSIDLDRPTALDRICEELKGIALNETHDGTKIRTTDGDLLAIIAAAPEGTGCLLHYRTAPASATATLKARRLWQTLEAFAD